MKSFFNIEFLLINLVLFVIFCIPVVLLIVLLYFIFRQRIPKKVFLIVALILLYPVGLPFGSINAVAPIVLYFIVPISVKGLIAYQDSLLYFHVILFPVWLYCCWQLVSVRK